MFGNEQEQVKKKMCTWKNNLRPNVSRALNSPEPETQKGEQNIRMNQHIITPECTYDVVFPLTFKGFVYNP